MADSDATVRRGRRRAAAMQQMRLRIIRNAAMLSAAGRAPMYVCLCNSLTDGDLRPHMTAGIASVLMVYQACGCRPQCGKCVPFVRQMLREQSELGAADVPGDD